jgi:dihydroorotate dehydrogenase (NAD+) catalytic subunit
MTENGTKSRLNAKLRRLEFKNPILVASGTFGYAKEMTAFVDFNKLGGIIPKTITPLPRTGNDPPRTIETSSGLLNSIGLDNDGIDEFLKKHIDYLLSLGTSIIVNIAGKNVDEYCSLAEKLNQVKGIAGLELNVSCPNVSGGVDFGTNPESTARVVSKVVNSCDLPIITKLTPNVTSVIPQAQAAADAGSDAVSLVNTFQGIVIDWKKRKPVLGGKFGGLSGPAIKPLALRIVTQVSKAVDVPIIGVGGISTIDDVMEYLVAGASAIQIGTANFYNPGVASNLVDQLEQILDEEKCSHYSELVGTLQL